MDKHNTVLDRAIEVMTGTGLTEKRALGIAKDLRDNGIIFKEAEEE